MVFAEELARLGSVPRTLTFDAADQSPDVNLPEFIPNDYVSMAAPQLLVEVSVKRNKNASDDEDDERVDDSCEDDGSRCFFYFFSGPPTNVVVLVGVLVVIIFSKY